MIDESHLRQLYEAFNARDIEAVLNELAPDVRWANGMEGGFVKGCDNVRAYWQKQFETLRPRLQVLALHEDKPGRAIFDIHQTVHDLNGALLLEQNVTHRFTLRDGKIALFEIVGHVEEKE